MGMLKYTFLKSTLDKGCACFLLVGLLPLFVIGVCVCWLLGKRDIIFCQERTGLDGKPFVIYKIRTMKVENGKNRISQAGKILRTLSIDELPSLVNIAKGEMSFVGPRPLRHEDLRYLTVLERQRNRVRPGLTGLAQVNGRNNTTWNKRFEYDLEYLDIVSLKTDLRILVMTVIVVLTMKGVNESADTTMPELRYR